VILLRDFDRMPVKKVKDKFIYVQAVEALRVARG
jgi:hypothetical protein